MADEELHDNRTVKYNTKDSVFTKLFRIEVNLLRLYKELHPEDMTTTLEDIQLKE